MDDRERARCLANALKTAQRRLKWTNAQVAKVAGTDERRVYTWRSGKELMGTQYVLRLQRHMPGFLELTQTCAL